jgi:UTP--glucose-1-phosphate uridylyltransferase
MVRRIRKAVFPVAGLGTRFLPATKAMPKEMLTVVDRPLIQHVVDEAKLAGIEHFVFVTGRNKSLIEDHFDKQYELEATLQRRGKIDALESLSADLPQAGQASFTRQQEPLGLGHAIWCARDLIGREPFAIILPDVLIQSEKGCLAEMIDSYNMHGGNVLAVEESPDALLHQYGVIDAGVKRVDGSIEIRNMVEKPPKGSAPSNLTITGRYILQPDIFDILETQATGAGGEIQLTDAMLRLLEDQHFHGVKFSGKSYDCGSKNGFLLANVAYALSRKDIAPEFAPGLRALMQELNVN